LRSAWAVIVADGVHRANQRDVVGVLGDVGKEVRYVHAALAILLEFPGRGHETAGRALGDDIVAHAGHRFALAFEQLGLGVEDIDLAGPAVAKNRDAIFRFRREMRAHLMLGPRGGQQSLVSEKVGKGETGDTAAKFLKQLSSVVGDFHGV
jgi:hypothetical protein